MTSPAAKTIQHLFGPDYVIRHEEEGTSFICRLADGRRNSLSRTWASPQAHIKNAMLHYWPSPEAPLLCRYLRCLAAFDEIAAASKHFADALSIESDDDDRYSFYHFIDIIYCHYCRLLTHVEKKRFDLLSSIFQSWFTIAHPAHDDSLFLYVLGRDAFSPPPRHISQHASHIIYISHYIIYFHIIRHDITFDYFRRWQKLYAY